MPYFVIAERASGMLEVRHNEVGTSVFADKQKATFLHDRLQTRIKGRSETPRPHNVRRHLRSVRIESFISKFECDAYLTEYNRALKEKP